MFLFVWGGKGRRSDDWNDWSGLGAQALDAVGMMNYESFTGHSEAPFTLGRRFEAMLL